MKNPDWLKDHLYDFKSFDDIPQQVFDSINADLDKRLCSAPVVSVVICAYNEEANIIKTISSLSRLRTNYPFEILVVNNNSDDRTQDTLDKLHIRSVFQPIQGWGASTANGVELCCR